MANSKHHPTKEDRKGPVINICMAAVVPNGKPIRLLRGAGGKITCSKSGARCPSCVHR